ncbi:AP-4 complex accessory subunit tepsin [Portunus trituberculatus]|uniref:AP-4 complex accessory subunit tepsin n=1 Tax=Portunus trituberculatus TaxID=210409 RepID=A0A5B7EIR4_PORTR|nr:AP-4 complex accessory subunit tepsin [Portunus trituberculatus]
MELLKEAKNVVDFASYYPLLNKATTDNDTPTPGYVYEEIIKMSHNSSGHRQLLIDFLLARLHSSSWPGKQKVIRIFQHLCTRGHRGVRVTLRGQDGELRKAAAAGGPPDPLLANTPQLFLSSAIQELLTQLFDSKTMKEDEQWLAGRDKSEESSSSSLSVAPQGYGSHGVKGKYEGFGSSPNVPSESLVTQVRGMVERVMSTSVDTNSLDLLKGDKGDYQPLSLPSLGSVPPSQPVPQIQMQLLSASQKNKYKAHRKGRAGGGWESDEDTQELPASPLTSDLDLSPGPASSHSSSDAHSSGAAEEQLLNTLTDAKMRWPLDHDMLVGISRDCATLNLPLLLGKISNKCSLLAAPTTNDPQAGEISSSSTNYPFLIGCDSKDAVPPLASPDADTRTTRLLALLLLVEFGMHYDVLPPALVHSHLGQTLTAVKENKNLESAVQLKARKLSLIVSNFV